MEIILHSVNPIKPRVPINLSEDERSLNLHAIRRFSRCHVALSRRSIAVRSDGSDHATSPGRYKIFEKLSFNQKNRFLIPENL